jgi:hypothetical protein
MMNAGTAEIVPYELQSGFSIASLLKSAGALIYEGKKSYGPRRV